MVIAYYSFCQFFLVFNLFIIYCLAALLVSCGGKYYFLKISFYFKYLIIMCYILLNLYCFYLIILIGQFLIIIYHLIKSKIIIKLIKNL